MSNNWTFYKWEGTDVKGKSGKKRPVKDKWKSAGKWQSVKVEIPQHYYWVEMERTVTERMMIRTLSTSEAEARTHAIQFNGMMALNHFSEGSAWSVRNVGSTPTEARKPRPPELAMAT